MTATATAREAVHAEGSLRLHRYGRSSSAPPVVLVYSWINRPGVLDLLPERSVVRSLLDAGLDVWLADWGEPGRLESTLDLGGHLDRLARVCRVAERATGGRGVSLLGYCLGGTAALALAALEPGLVRAIALLATPVAVSERGMLAAWVRGAGIDPGKLAVTPEGNVPGTLLREMFRWLDPVGQWKKWAFLAERGHDDAILEPFLAQERWANDPVDFPGRLFRDVIVGLYREDGLARGTLAAGGRRIDLSRVTAPILNVVSEGDRIVPPEDSVALEALAPRVRTLRVQGGHIGMTVGRKAKETTHRELVSFLLEGKS
jgi:polyhydroxyalkanoate synthase